MVFTDNTFNYYVNLTSQHGRHYFTIGGQATRYQQNYINAGNVGFLGQFTYSGIFSANVNATDGPGYGPGDFVRLTGLPTINFRPRPPAALATASGGSLDISRTTSKLRLG